MPSPDTVPIYTRVSRATHEWLAREAHANGVTIAMLSRLLLDQNAGKRIEIQRLVITNVQVGDDD